MESLVTKPTQWMRSLVVVEKPNGKLWVCPDPKDLNRAILSHHYPMITLEVVLLNCQKLDSSLSWMLGKGIGLSSYQKHLLTSLRLIRQHLGFRFGLKSSQDEFQRKFKECYEDLDGVVALVDDLLVFG